MQCVSVPEDRSNRWVLQPPPSVPPGNEAPLFRLPLPCCGFLWFLVVLLRCSSPKSTANTDCWSRPPHLLRSSDRPNLPSSISLCPRPVATCSHFPVPLTLSVSPPSPPPLPSTQTLSVCLSLSLSLFLPQIRTALYFLLIHSPFISPSPLPPSSLVPLTYSFFLFFSSSVFLPLFSSSLNVFPPPPLPSSSSFPLPFPLFPSPPTGSLFNILLAFSSVASSGSFSFLFSLPIFAILAIHATFTIPLS
ncbi:hypothetical protein BP00DRAFT_91700 [Aspergillus indologenus CBS 114.80]|uniref:Uncharacterized protein n=1 Tax=Aspergillus indologenus CBS 114.80 TaxID=1450541 RepID=A0A2V5IJ03_9EURO|nr:hypothetical protein BP00DRAFT_91700 [Aspergillus indologenus CBS 114.80]